ncbi:MAG: hypothetical protein QOG41_2401 [Thermoleophilaceae bacterium]|jgi:hypothetical protein|nr:hypothetical protein [Thermoleophilaceae bacterium]MEA2389628.1 hypothetical protein [Thermoleophilaceae bacterium]
MATTEEAARIEREKSSHGGSGRQTEPVDYAAINAVYAALAAGLLYATRERSAQDPIPVRELVPLSAATFALSKVIAREKVGTWMREPFVEQDGHAPRPKGRRLQRAVGELLTCTRCVGAWSALGIVGLRVASPATGRTVSNVLAASAANDFMQAGFRWLCNRSD